MGALVSINGVETEVVSYSVDQESTPAVVGDSSGAVGSFRISIAAREAAAFHLSKGSPVVLTDSLYGTIAGTVAGVTTRRGMAELVCTEATARLVINGVVAQPFSGTLEAAFQYYASLGGIDPGEVDVDESVADQTVALLGWQGELWYRIKMLAAAWACEVDVDSSNVIVRPIRQRVASTATATGGSVSAPITKVSQKVELYLYETAAFTDERFYPMAPNDTDFPSVAAGQPMQIPLTIEASFSSVDQPVYNPDMSIDDTDASQFMLTYGDDKIVTQAQWDAGGSYVELVPGEDTRSATLLIVAPIGVLGDDGAPVTSFNMSVELGGIRFGTLQLKGTGVSYKRTSHTYGTGATAEQSEQEIGTTVDNEFINTKALLLSHAANVASVYGSGVRSLSVDLAPSVAWRQADGTPTTLNVFGNVAGASIFDSDTQSWYRVRRASIERGSVRCSDADEDLTNADIQAAVDGMTFEEVRSTWYDGLTFAEARTLGVPR